MNRDTRTGDTGTTAIAPSGTVTGMTPNDTSHLEAHGPFMWMHWKLKRAICTTFVLITVSITVGLASLQEFKGACFFAFIAAVWLVIWAQESGWAEGYRDAQRRTAEKAIEDAKVEATRAAEEQLALDAAMAPKPIVAEVRSTLDGEGFVYVIRFNTGAIKVGQTVEPQVRLNKHRRDAEVYKVHIVDYWISPQHANYLTNETLLIERCHQVGIGVKKEYFHGMDFADAVQIAGRLPYLCAAEVPA